MAVTRGAIRCEGQDMNVLLASVYERMHAAGATEYQVLWNGDEVASCEQKLWAERIVNALNRSYLQDQRPNWDPSEDG